MESACGLSVRMHIWNVYASFAREYVLNAVVCLVVCHKSTRNARQSESSRFFCYFLLEHCVFRRLLHEVSERNEMINHYYTFHLIAI